MQTLRPNPVLFDTQLAMVERKGLTLFVTYRLNHSIPLATLDKLRQEYEADESAIVLRYTDQDQKKEELYKAQKRYFGKFDAYLDQQKEPKYKLTEAKMCDFLMEGIHKMADSYFDLWAFVVMPNHVHLLMSIAHAEVPFFDILQQHKRLTTLFAQRLYQEKFKLWAHESYDHLVRDQGEFERIVRYMMNNPIKAGWVNNWQEWPYRYCNSRLLLRQQED
ncbi:MAG: transposase [Cytophagales bacterium]|nr:MAG: transposase [Cytophagales bacterium]TAF61728.1 MAG: transposase [Cytophagales bacterium]